MTRIETLVIIHQKPRVLLAMKKQRFGVGHYNGFGGGLEEGETLQECAIRETREEAGIGISELKYMGKILFKFLDRDEQDHEVHFYKTTNYEGEPKETEEMAPIWFEQDSLPYNEMWIDDKYWMPLLLEDKKFLGEFHFTKDGIGYHKLNEVLEL
ncbi:MAG: 8-oxo-dGTP diphosphatase [Nanoarchaeota archaeon]|nr:8-oxo-dGTP diphosphatase [Nanoarchaeota archaeon]